MGALLLGGLALVLVLLLLRGFIGADVKILMRGLRYFGAALLLFAAIGLAAFDRVGLAMLAGSFAWGLFTGGRAWPHGWPHWTWRPGNPQGSGAPEATRSRVGTAWLEVELDHDSGDMSGLVLKGTFAGRAMDGLSRDDLSALYLEMEAVDPESIRILDAYAQRRFGVAWRRPSSTEQPPARGESGMSREEAYRVLGLQTGASETEIRAAHRRLMVQSHPDRGGSSYLAAKVNEAKDVLFGR